MIKSMSRLFNQFRSALMFITILPAGRDVPYSPMGMIKFFPLVGLVLGGLLAGLDLLASGLWPAGTVAVLNVFFLVVVTGAFHLDGLGDAADGLFSHRSKKRALEIMKDSRSGMMGLVAVFSILALKVSGIYALKTAQSATLVFFCLLIIPAYARGAMIFGIRFLNYGRKGTGTGLDLFERPLGVRDFSFFLIPVFLSLFLGYPGLFLNIGFIITLIGVLAFYKKILGCITGDMLGALTEVMETVLFMAVGMAWI